MKKITLKIAIIMILLLGFMALDAKATSVTDWLDIKEAIISYSSSTQYTGEIPDVVNAFKMKDGVIKDQDYSVEHTINRKDVGTYKITIKGKGDYLGSSFSWDYSITPAPITLTQQNEVKSYTYTGKRIWLDAKDIKLTFNGKDVEDDEWEFYTNGQEDNIEVGDSFILIIGVGNFGNIPGAGKTTKKINFKILPKDLSTTNITVSDLSDKEYTGNPITVNISINDSIGTLEEGKDYTVEYKNNTNVGTASVIITGIGNYTGEIIKTFNIVETDSPIIDNAQDANDKYDEALKDEEDKLEDFEDSILNNNTNKNESTDKKEETTQKENNKKDETSKDTSKKEDNKKEEPNKEDLKDESNEVENTNKEENVNTGSNEIYISNQTTDATTTEKQSNSTFILKYALYVTCGILAVVLWFIVYYVFKYRKIEKQ